ITAGALIVVGFLMINIVREIDWDRFEEAFPAFLTIIGIPMTYSISHGVGIGFITYMLIRLMSGRWRELHPFMYVVSMAFLLGFLLPHLPL
ncbi:MAG: NCS2 family permease, partial [Nitrospiraceae bacterium]|nr:NCS2 family permease [Nitrospiraceae bacterium]